MVLMCCRAWSPAVPGTSGALAQRDLKVLGCTPGSRTHTGEGCGLTHGKCPLVKVLGCWVKELWEEMSGLCSVRGDKTGDQQDPRS